MGVYSLPDGKGGQVNYNFDTGSKKVLGPDGKELGTFQRHSNGSVGIYFATPDGNNHILNLNPATGVVTSPETGATVQGQYSPGQNESGMASEDTGDNRDLYGPADTGDNKDLYGPRDTGDTGDGTSPAGGNSNVYTYQGHNYYLNPSDNQFYGDAGLTQGTNYYLKNGKIIGPDNKPILGASVSGNIITYTKPETKPETKPTIVATVTYGAGTNAGFLALMSDGTILDANGEFLGSYSGNAQGGYDLFDKSGKPFGTYDPKTGVYTGSNGATLQTTYQEPSPDLNLPDLSNVQGPTSTNQSESTSYSGIGQQYAPTISGWMSNLNESLQPQAYHNLISGAYNTAKGQVGNAYNTAQNQVPGLYNTARGQTGRAYTAAQGQIPGIYDTARDQSKQGFQEAQNYLPEVYQQRVSPMLQGAINSLVKRNILDSTVGGNTIANAANLAYQSILPQQTALAGQEAGVNANLAGQQAGALAGIAGRQAGALTGLAGQQAGAGTSLAGAKAAQQSGLANKEAAYQTAYPATLASATGNLGKYSQTHTTSSGLSKNPLAPYALVYGTIPYMAQYGNG